MQFELHGNDVLICWSLNYATPKFGTGLGEHFVSIEIKPSLGDDYPAVMRQIQRLTLRHLRPKQCLLIDSYAGHTIPFLQLRDMFKANGVQLVTLREIEDRMPPEFPKIPA